MGALLKAAKLIQVLWAFNGTLQHAMSYSVLDADSAAFD